MNLELMKRIVDGAPEWADSFNVYIAAYGSGRVLCKGDILLADLRTAIADHEKCQHKWNETTSNGDAYRFLVCKHCDSTQNYVPFEVDYCTDIRNHIRPNTKVIEK